MKSYVGYRLVFVFLALALVFTIGCALPGDMSPGEQSTVNPAGTTRGTQTFTLTIETLCFNGDGSTYWWYDRYSVPAGGSLGISTPRYIYLPPMYNNGLPSYQKLEFSYWAGSMGYVAIDNPYSCNTTIRNMQNDATLTPYYYLAQ